MSTTDNLARELYVGLFLKQEGVIDPQAFQGLAALAYAGADAFVQYQNKKEADEAAKYVNLTG